MVDSGIKPTKELIEAMATMEKTSTMPYDYVLATLVKGERKGTKISWDLKMVRTSPRGTAEKEFEGKDLKGECPVFNAVRKVCVEEYLNDSCYFLFNMSYVLEGNRPQDKLVFLVWCPEETPVSKKMTTSSTTDSFKKTAPSNAIKVIRNDKDDFDFEDVKKIVSVKL